MARSTVGGLEARSTLIRRARRVVIGSAMLVGASFSPLIVGIGLDAIGHGYLAEPWELVALSAWAPALGALLAWRVMARALPRELATDEGARAAGAGGAILSASVAGALYPVLFFVPLAILSASTDLSAVVLVPGIALAIGAIPGAIAGAMCGCALGAGIGMLHEHVVSPAHDLIEHACGAAAVMCAVGAVVSLLPIAALEGIYCSTLLLVIAPALGIEPPPGTDLAWTRFVVLIAPALAAAVALAARAALHRQWSTQRIDALRAGTHPELALGEAMTIAGGVLPLRAEDRGAPIARPVTARAGSAPYREAGLALAFLADRR